MNRRLSALLVTALLIGGAAVAWVGKPETDVNMTSVGELWSDIFRDGDQFGLQLTRVSAAEEMDLGKKIALGLVRSRTTSPMWEVYVNAVGQNLAKHALRKDIRYEFHVIDAPSRNAFALPGGQIFVYTGMLEEMQSEAELAGVLGHEIAHVDARHCIERYQYQMRLRKLGLGDVAGLARLGQAIIQQGYAQYQELEADAMGLRFTLAAGYDPNGLVSLFDRMLRQTGQPDVQVPAATPFEELARLANQAAFDYFRSHPPTYERLRRLRGLIEQWSKSHAGARMYRGVENFRKKIARPQQEFDGEFLRL